MKRETKMSYEARVEGRRYITQGERLREGLGLMDEWNKLAVTEGLKGGNQRCGQVNPHPKEQEGICMWSG